MFIEPVPPDAATGDLAEYYAQQRAAWGFLPDYAGAFSSRPDVAAAWNALNSTIRSGMDRRRYELATIAAARALRSTYCTAAHSMFLRDACADEATMRRICADPSGSGLDEQDRAVYTFATRVALDAASVTREDVDALKAAGLSDAEVADVVFAAAARSFFTRVLDGLGATADAEIMDSFDPLLRPSLVVGRPPATPGAGG